MIVPAFSPYNLYAYVSENPTLIETLVLQVHRRFVSASGEQNAELNEMVDLCNSHSAALDPSGFIAVGILSNSVSL